ncbi:MAG TPA: DUF721 domain-containing protein [Desulfuromonadales bacterium]|nr:DUF721 domain-containing protein [Desulfuromonadales bacterium]
MRRRRPPMRRAAAAGDLLEQLLQSMGLDKRIQQYRAMVIWDEVVGTQIASQARPVRIRGAVLEVCVEQAAWMQQLQLMKPQILKKLNAELGEGQIEEIFLKKGKIPPRAQPAPQPPPAWQKIRLNPGEAEEIAATLQSVDDPDLRSSLGSMLSKQARLLKAAANREEPDGEEQSS